MRLRHASRVKKDLGRAKRRGKDLAKLRAVVEQFLNPKGRTR